MAPSPTIVLARCLGTLAGIAFVLTLACDSDPAAPPPASPPAPFYPLRLGEAWTYERARTVRFIAFDGSEVEPRVEFHGTAERELTTTEELAGADYVVERQWLFADGGDDTVTTWRRYRQGASGLYRALVAFSVPPGSVPPLDSLSELTVLQYPLTLNSSWAASPGSATTRRVESIDTLTTSRGSVRGVGIRTTTPSDGPKDSHREWFGTDGLLRAIDHTEVLAVDPGTGEVIRIVSDESSELIERH